MMIRSRSSRPPEILARARTLPFSRFPLAGALLLLLAAAVGADQDPWTVGAPSAEKDTPGKTALRIANTGSRPVSVQVIWSGGVWSSLVPSGGERSLDLKQGGDVDYVLKAGDHVREGTFSAPAGRELRWRVACAGEPAPTTPPAPPVVEPMSVDLVLPANAFRGFEQLSVPEKIAVLEKAVAAEYRGNPQVTKALAILHNNHGLELQKQKNWPEAVTHLRRAVELAPDDRGIRTNLAVLHHNRGIELAESRDYPAAEREMAAALETSRSLGGDVETTVSATYSDILVQRGIQDQEKGWLDSAAGQYDRATRFNRNNAVAWYRLGELHYARHELDQAADCLRRAAALSSRSEVRSRLEQVERELAVAAEFTTRQAGRFRISFEGAENAAVAADVRSLLRRAYRDVGHLLRHYPRDEIPVVIYNSGQFGHVTRLGAWVGAAYDGKIRLRVDPQEKGDREYLLTKLKNQVYHEYTHAVVHSLAGGSVPAWLNEGLAQYVAEGGSLSEEEEFQLAVAASRGALPPLSRLNDSLVGISEPAGVSRAYLASKSFVQWLVKRFGLHRIRSLLKDLGTGTSPPKAVDTHFGRSLADLETEWREAARVAR